MIMKDNNNVVKCKDVVKNNNGKIHTKIAYVESAV